MGNLLGLLWQPTVVILVIGVTSRRVRILRRVILRPVPIPNKFVIVIRILPQVDQRILDEGDFSSLLSGEAVSNSSAGSASTAVTSVNS